MGGVGLGHKGSVRGYPKGEADPTSPKPLQPAVLDPVLISRRDFLLATRKHMELDGWPVGSRVYLEKWACPGLGRAIPDLGAKAAKAAVISTGDGGDFWGHKGAPRCVPRSDRKPSTFVAVPSVNSIQLPWSQFVTTCLPSKGYYISLWRRSRR